MPTTPKKKITILSATAATFSIPGREIHTSFWPTIKAIELTCIRGATTAKVPAMIILLRAKRVMYSRNPGSCSILSGNK